MKKNCIIQAVLVALLVGQPTMAQDRSQASHKAMPGVAKPERISRLKKEYQVFREAFKCVRQKGFRGCTPAQKKRIVVVVISLAALVGMFGIFGYRFIVIPQVSPDGGGEDDVIEVGKPEPRESPKGVVVIEELSPPVFIKTFKDGTQVGATIIGESASYTVTAPRPPLASLRSPLASLRDRFRTSSSKRESPVKEKKVKEKKGPLPTAQPVAEQPVQEFSSTAEATRAEMRAIETGESFRGRGGGAVLQGRLTDPDFREKKEAFIRELHQGN